jgi:erythromycin esterase-like protein
MTKSLIAALVMIVGVALQTAPTAWITTNAVPLTTTEPGRGFDDLQPLKKMIGDARIVALGEATHGTREFFQLKHRMLEFLATEMGFTVFSIEANMTEAYRLNDYVLHGTGDPALLLKGLGFWTWDTEEVLDMIKWMRAFNASGKGRVQFTGFDMQTPTVAVQTTEAFVSRYDAPYSATLAEAVRGVAKASTVSPATAIGVATAGFPVADAVGRKVRFTGYIKTEGITRGYAGLLWTVNGSSGVLAFDNMQARGATGTADWKPFVIELPVGAAATSISFGVLMPGDGTAWFDDLVIEFDGRPYTNPTFDFGFEEPSLRGFNAGGTGYRVELDTAVAHSGKQSLRISYIPASITIASATGNATAPRVVASQWKEVLSHLEFGREGYIAQGATAGEVDWAIQNVRVVLQGLQMRSNEVSRDQSMADNVTWVVDHNPGAKVVLWAHNGHVGASGFGDSMGAALRRSYGKDLFVFGFAFGQGSFQALAQSGNHPLKVFTVPEAPPGSLDAMLASAGLPLFALDLREAPAWFREARSSREIGSAYPDGDPFAFMMSFVAPAAFDAMLYVDRTTAARKNPAR